MCGVDSYPEFQYANTIPTVDLLGYSNAQSKDYAVERVLHVKSLS
jgi:hypothetical protein